MGGSCSSAAEFSKSCQVLTVGPQIRVKCLKRRISFFNHEGSPMLLHLRVSSRLIYSFKHNQYGLSHHWELGEVDISK